MSDYSKHINLSMKLGERILEEQKLTGVIVKVDLTYGWNRGYGPHTPPDSEYPVIVHYRDSDGALREVTKYFNHMGEILKAFEDFEEEVYD